MTQGKRDLRGSTVLEMHLAYMATLRDVDPVETQVRNNRDTDEQEEDEESNEEFDNLAMQCRGGEPLRELLDIWLEECQQRGDEK